MMHQETAIGRLQRLTGDAELAAAVAAGVAEHGTAFSLYVATVATDSELVASLLTSGFRSRYLGSFTDHEHAHRFLLEQFRETQTLLGQAAVSDKQALGMVLALLHIVDAGGTAYVFTRQTSVDALPDPPEP